MRNQALLLASLLAAAAVTSGCPGNNPSLPPLYQGGWSWNPSASGDRPVPVIWSGSSPAPQALGFLPGDCSGSVQALAVNAGQPVPVGISVMCSEDSPPRPERMLPVFWTGTTPTQLPLRLTTVPAETQGTALAVSVFTWKTSSGETKTDVYVAGATGILSPIPAVWKNGVLTNLVEADLLPTGYDAGLITAIASTDLFVVASGLVHFKGGRPSELSAMIWVFDPDLEFVDTTELFGFLGGVGPALAMFLDTDQTVWSTAAISLGSDPGVPVYWKNEAFNTLGGSDLLAGPFGVPTDISVVGVTPYATGYAISPQLRMVPRPSPVIWAGDIRADLSTADPGIGVGAGEAIGIINSWALVAGETVGADPTSASRFLSVPAVWNNGARQDLQPLVAPGTGPATVVSLPLFGWWRVPPTVPLPEPPPDPDWPYPGGSSAVFGSVPITAAGSGVARAIAADLPPP
ncbi:MAG: hypothetical protein WCS72_07820 [Deltaproteobacteria bacterium]